MQTFSTDQSVSSSIPILKSHNQTRKYPPILRRQSTLATDSTGSIYKKPIKQVAFKRRTFSLIDNKDIMTTSIYFDKNEMDKNEDNSNEPKVGVNLKSDDDNKLNTDSLLVSNISIRDSLENLKYSTYDKEEDGKTNTERTNPSISLDIEEKPTKLSKFNDESNLNPPKKLLPSKTKTFIKDNNDKPKVEPKTKSRPASNVNKITNEELCKQYENEIRILKKQLQDVGGNILPNEEALMKKCASLEGQLRQAQNDKESIEDQLNGLRVQLKTWPNKVTELEEENANLRSRIDDVRTINQQRQNEIDELHEIVKNLETKLWEQSSGSQQQEKIFLQRLMHEYDNLLKDYEMMKLTSMTNERKLYETRNRFNELTNRISELEMTSRKLESENNFLKRRLNNDRNFGTSDYRGWSRGAQAAYNSFHSGTSHEILNAPEVSFNRENEPASGNSEMMSISCYGALPSYNSQSKHSTATTTPTSASPIQSSSMMSQSMYASLAPSSQDGIGNVPRPGLVSGSSNSTRGLDIKENAIVEAVTPTLEKRRVSIIDDYSQQQSSQQRRDPNRSARQISYSGASSFDILPGSGSSSNLMTSSASADQWAVRQQQKIHMTEDEREMERRYDQLHQEKKHLLTQLSHIPSNTSTARNRRLNRENKESVESKLDQVDRQLGLLKMTLKQKHIL